MTPVNYRNVMLLLFCQRCSCRLVTPYCRQLSVFHMFGNSTTRRPIAKLGNLVDKLLSERST